MERIVSLSHLTVIELAPPDVVSVAAAAGLRHIGLRLSPAAPGEPQRPMIGDTPMMRETLARLADTGVSVFDFEILRLARNTDVADFLPVLESGARLGARNVIVAGDESDENLLADRFAALCGIGRQFGLEMSLEFMPWTGVKTLAQAVRIVKAAGQPNARVLIDPIHLDRSKGTLAEVSAVPRDLLAYAQICDALAERPSDYETIIFQARNERLFPGHGDLDLLGLLRALPPDLPLSLEVPTRKLAQDYDPVERARLALGGLKSLLRKLDQDDETRLSGS
jgi:sugar phosphate isomerase/epimerase